MRERPCVCACPLLRVLTRRISPAGRSGTDVDPRSASGTLALSPTALLRTSTAASVGPSGPPSAVASAQERLAGSLPRCVPPRCSCPCESPLADVRTYGRISPASPRSAASERALPPSTQHIPPPLAPPRRPRLSDSLREEQREVQRAALRHDKEVAHWQSLGGSAGRQLRHERLDDAQRGVAGEGSLLDGETADESLRRMAEGAARPAGLGVAALPALLTLPACAQAGPSTWRTQHSAPSRARTTALALRSPRSESVPAPRAPPAACHCRPSLPAPRSAWRPGRAWRAACRCGSMPAR